MTTSKHDAASRQLVWSGALRDIAGFCTRQTWFQLHKGRPYLVKSQRCCPCRIQGSQSFQSFSSTGKPDSRQTCGSLGDAIAHCTLIILDFEPHETNKRQYYLCSRLLRYASSGRHTELLFSAAVYFCNLQLLHICTVFAYATCIYCLQPLPTVQRQGYPRFVKDDKCMNILIEQHLVGMYVCSQVQRFLQSTSPNQAFQSLASIASTQSLQQATQRLLRRMPRHQVVGGRRRARPPESIDIM